MGHGEAYRLLVALFWVVLFINKNATQNSPIIKGEQLREGFVGTTITP